MMKTLFNSIIAVYLVSVSFTSLAAEKGYFWYQEKEKKEETDIKEFQKPEPKHYSQDEMMKMHPDFLAQILDEHHKYAIQTLEESDYENYMLVLDVARKKAAAATSLHSVTLLNNQQLNPNSDYPITNSGKNSRKKNTESLIINRLRQESSSYALGFFMSPSCSYCKDQIPSLKLFQDKTGWNIKEINIDQRPDLAQRFDIKSTPQLVLIARGSDLWKKVAIGVESLPKIEQNTYKTIRLIEGEITPKEFNLLENQEGGFFDNGEQL